MVPYRARSDCQGVARIIGCPLEHVPALDKAGLLPRLNPDRPGVVAYFYTAALLVLGNDPEWLVAATAYLKGTASRRQLSSARTAVRDAIQNARPTGNPGVAGSTGWILNEWISALFRDPKTGELLPGSIGDEPSARILGYRMEDMQRLRRFKQLKCLNPEDRHAPKRHARELIRGYVTDFAWLSTTTLALNDYWLKRNAGKGSGLK
jgi:hypothetical protein